MATLSPHSPSTVASSSSEDMADCFAFWLVPGWLMWLACTLYAVFVGGGVLFRHLLPGATERGLLCLGASLAVFLLFVGPLGWPLSLSRKHVLALSAQMAGVLLGPWLLAAALLSRLEPVETAVVLRCVLLLGGYIVFAISLHRLSPHGYVSIQILLAGLGPLAAYLLQEFSAVYGIWREGWSLLHVTSVFTALLDAVQPAPAPWRYGLPLWLIHLLLLAVGALLCALLPRTACVPPEATRDDSTAKSSVVA